MREWLAAAQADILFEGTSLNVQTGQPAIDQIKVIRNTVDHLTKDLPGAIQKWREIMGV